MTHTALKKAAACALLLGSVIVANAEGYQINTLSARQNGMGHTGTSLKLGAESMIFNPGALAFMKNNMELSATGTFIFAHASATLPEGGKYTTSNGASTPLAVNLAMKVYDNFSAGISFYTPYGSGINWGDNWPGAVLNQAVSLQMFTVQPTLSWRILPNLSIGAGAMVSWGKVDLDKGLVDDATVNGVLTLMGSQYRFTDTPASINLNGKAAATVGVHVGAMWDINRQWTVGADFRTKMTMKVKSGQASVRYANEIAQGLLQDKLNLINEANFTASMPAPAVLTFGASYRPDKRLTLALEAQWTFWSAYRSLDIEFLSESLAGFNQNITKNYHNSWTFHAGAQYALTRRFDLRLGLMVDTTPVNSDHFNPETPGMTKIEPSCGFSFRPIRNFSIDASLLYVAGLGRDGTCPVPNLLTGQASTFAAHYNVHAWSPSIGASVSF